METLFKTQKSLLAGVAIFIIAALFLVGEEGDPGLLADAKNSYEHKAEAAPAHTVSLRRNLRAGPRAVGTSFRRGQSELDEPETPRIANDEESGTGQHPAGGRATQSAGASRSTQAAPRAEKTTYSAGEILIHTTVRKLD